jgi:hypothetical protein
MYRYMRLLVVQCNSFARKVRLILFKRVELQRTRRDAFGDFQAIKLLERTSMKSCTTHWDFNEFSTTCTSTGACRERSCLSEYTPKMPSIFYISPNWFSHKMYDRKLSMLFLLLPVATVPGTFTGYWSHENHDCWHETLWACFTSR